VSSYTSPLAGTVYTGTKEPQHCSLCDRNPSKVNSEHSECSVVECRYRGRCWSDRPTAEKLFKGPYPKNVDADPRPLDAKKRGDR
jgi:hypothetical protein